MANQRALFTTLGPLNRERLGMILPHEHVFVDLRTPDQPGYAQAEAADVVALMAPQIEAIKALGITALVECSTGGVGRRADLDLAVSQATEFPHRGADRQLSRAVDPGLGARRPARPSSKPGCCASSTSASTRPTVKAGWIKISAGDDGITPLEARILRAAARPAKATGAVIGSHTIKGRVVMDQLDIIEAEGYSAEPLHLDPHPGRDRISAAQPGGGGARRLDRVRQYRLGAGRRERAAHPRALEAGQGRQLLLSHDMGWFDPACRAAACRSPIRIWWTACCPSCGRRAWTRPTIVQLTHDNPFEAFARPL